MAGCLQCMTTLQGWASQRQLDMARAVAAWMRLQAAEHCARPAVLRACSTAGSTIERVPALRCPPPPSARWVLGSHAIQAYACGHAGYQQCSNFAATLCMLSRPLGRAFPCSTLVSQSCCANSPLPQGIKVQALPVAEADGLVWVWPGQPEAHADAGPPPPLARPPPGFEVRPAPVLHRLALCYAPGARQLCVRRLTAHRALLHCLADRFLLNKPPCCNPLYFAGAR